MFLSYYLLKGDNKMVAIVSLSITAFIIYWDNKYPISKQLAYFLGALNIVICIILLNLFPDCKE